jgi:beta-lactamase class D
MVEKNAIADNSLLCAQNCTLVLLAQSTNKFEFINKPRALQRYTPFSTFKIANSLIALDLGVIKNLEQALSFNRKKHPVQKWWPKRWYKTPLTLAQAFKYSAVPIYQEIANTIGAKRMQNYLNQFDYGNKNIGVNVDSFWLNEKLKISAKEQVLFLQKIYRKRLALTDKSHNLLKQIMLVEQTDNYKLYAKTGTGHLSDNSVLAWYVGYVENKNGVYYFAINISAKDFSAVTQRRIDITKHYLAKAGII